MRMNGGLDLWWRKGAENELNHELKYPLESNQIFYGLNIVEIGSILKKQKKRVLFSVSASFAAVDYLFNEFSKQFKIKVIVIGAQYHDIEQRMIQSSLYPKEDVEKIIALAEHLANKTNFPTLLKVFNNSSLDEGVRRLLFALQANSQTELVDLV